MEASMTSTSVVLGEFIDNEVTNSAKKVLSESTPFWAGVEEFITWLRQKVATFFGTHVANLPVVGKWAARIGTSITELIFTVIGTFIGLLRTIFGTAEVWWVAHKAAMKAWDANESNGLLAQTYAYGKKMAGYFLEIMKQCFERAINAHNLQVSEEEKQDIHRLLDGLL